MSADTYIIPKIGKYQLMIPNLIKCQLMTPKIGKISAANPTIWSMSADNPKIGNLCTITQKCENYVQRFHTYYLRPNGQMVAYKEASAIMDWLMDLMDSMEA